MFFCRIVSFFFFRSSVKFRRPEILRCARRWDPALATLDKSEAKLSGADISASHSSAPASASAIHTTNSAAQRENDLYPVYHQVVPRDMSKRMSQF